MSSDDVYLAQAIALACDNVETGQGGPFGAVIVREGQLLATGVNRVTATHDPTAHAEVVAIRAACEAVGHFALEGAVLFASCEPCPMCFAAASWARLSRIVYAASQAEAARAGFDDRVILEELRKEPHARNLKMQRINLAGVASPFERWLASSQKVPY